MSLQVSNLEVSLCMDAKSTPLLGKYELGRLLGRGTFGKVYHARCVADGKAVAVKVLDKAGMAATASLLREVAAMSRLHHPHVLRLHEVLATRARIYLVLELAPGGDLQSRLAALPRRRLPEHTARRLFVQIVSALSCCHAQGVAHRDVKLQNILLDGDGNLKLCDFGFSALPTTLRDDGRLHTACGTPAYAAPEVLRHKAYDGAKADAWSSGVVLFVLLAGYLPFDDANVADMCRKQHRREYVFPRWVTHPARRLVSRLLDPNPATRVSVEALASHQWLNRSLSFDLQLTTNHPVCSLMAFQGPVANAFDIISMSPVLDLSSLFGRSGRSRGKWFMTTASPNHMLVLLGRTGEKLGYLVLTKKGVEGLPRGWFSSFTLMSVQMSEVAPPLMLVELELEDGNGEGQVFDWEELSLELGHVMGCYS